VFSARDDNLYAYPEHCGTSCGSLWVGHTSDYLESVPRLADGLVFVSTADAIVGFPVRCRAGGGTCEPSVRVDTGDYAPIEAADEGAVVVATHRGRPNSVMSIPTDCSGVCSPTWTASVDGDV